MLNLLDKSFEINLDAGKAVLHFEGEVTFDNSNQLKERAKESLMKTELINSLIIDLEKVPYLDSSGVGVLLSLFKFMRRRKGTLSIAAPNDKIKRVFEVTKMSEIIPVYENLEKAINDV